MWQAAQGGGWQDGTRQHSDAVVQCRPRIDGSRRIRWVRDGREGLGKGWGAGPGLRESET